jgi:hypothetical protein
MTKNWDWNETLPAGALEALRAIATSETLRRGARVDRRSGLALQTRGLATQPHWNSPNYFRLTPSGVNYVRKFLK